MGIRNIQTNRVIEEIIKKYLNKGRYPTFQTITHFFNQWLRDHRPGAPSFSPIKVFRKQKSNSSEFNQQLESIYTDLSDAYTASIDQSNRIMIGFNANETERKKILHDLQQLSKEIDELLLLSNQADLKYMQGRLISFNNMEQIDTTLTSAFVDIQNNQVTLKENLNQAKIIPINPENVKFHTLMPAAKESALNTVANAFDNNQNTAWWHVVKTKTPGSLGNEKSMGMRAELTILFEEEQEFNEISYIAHHGKPVYIKVEYTVNGTSFTHLPGINNYRKVIQSEVWSFEKIKAKGVKFIFEKQEHDDNSAGVYQFYFGAKEISIKNKTYQPTGVLITNPISFDHQIQELSASIKHEIPFNASIHYEVALYDQNKPLDDLIWYPISSSDDNNAKHSKVIHFNYNQTKIIETNLCEPTGQVINGMKVFRLLKENGEGIISEFLNNEKVEEENFEVIKKAQLFRGINQWKRESTYIPFKGTIPLQNEWEQIKLTNPQLIHESYQSINNVLKMDKTASTNSHNFYRFTTCVYTSERIEAPLSLSVVQTLPSGIKKKLGTYSVYLNNKRLIPNNDEVTLVLEKGWNEIQILYHWGDIIKRTDVSNQELPTQAYLGKFNFIRQEKIRAELNPMTYTDVHDLFHNVPPNNHDYFSIHERQVVLNYLPVNCLFQLHYDSVSLEELDSTTQVVFKATLERNEETIDVTPKIYSIFLKGR